MRTRIAIAASLAVLFMLSSVADAQQRGRIFRRAQPNQTRNARASSAFKSFAQQHNLSHAVHKGKLYIKADRSVLNRNFEQYARLGDGKVLEFAGTGHLHTRFNGKKDANFLSGLRIGTFQPPSYGKRVSVVVRLNETEHRELNSYIESASSSYQNARREIGSFNYNGGRPARYYPGSTKANCTTWISSAKLDGRQSLARACGVWEAASPTGWIRSLAQRGNSRVEAVMLHGFNGDVTNGRAVEQFVREATTKH